MATASKTGTVRFQPPEYYLLLSQDTFRLDKDNALVGGSTLTVTAKKRTDAVSNAGSGEVLITVTPDSGTAKTSTTGSLSFTVTSAMTRIVVALTDTARTVTHDQRTVMVVKDGATGATGAAGPSFYMAGEYGSATSYTRDSFKAPVVLLDGLYYAQKKTGTITGINPKTDVANNGGNWAVFDMFKYIFTEVAFILFGKLGSAIFNGDFMFSQYGVDSSGVQNQDYTSFDPSLSDPTTNAAFMPNILLNFLTGKAIFNDIVAKGEIYASKGIFSGYIRSSLLNIAESDAVPVTSNYQRTGDAYRLKDNLYVDATFCEVVLPCSVEYAGARVIIMDTYFVKSRSATPPTVIRAESGAVYCGLLESDYTTIPYAIDAIQIDCGAVELIYKAVDNDGSIENKWIVVSHSCALFEAYSESAD